MTHALSPASRLSLSVASARTRKRPVRFAASSPSRPERKTAMPIARTVSRRLPRETQKAMPKIASVSSGSTQATAFRSWKASCAVSSSSERRTSTRPASSSIRSCTVSLTPIRSAASMTMLRRSIVTAPSSVETVPLRSSSTSTSVSCDSSSARRQSRRSSARPSARSTIEGPTSRSVAEVGPASDSTSSGSGPFSSSSTSTES